MGKKIQWGSPALTVMLLLLNACTSFVQQPAPVENPTGIPVNRPLTHDTAPTAVSVAQAVPYKPDTPVRAIETEKTHVVQPGDTLFRIALNNGIKYQDLAKWNNLKDYNINLGQTIRLTPGGNASTVTLTTSDPPSKLAPAAPLSPTHSSGPCLRVMKLPYSAEAVKQLAADDVSRQRVVPVEPIAIESNAPKVIPKQEASAKSISQSNTRAEASAAVASKGENSLWSWPTVGKIIRQYSQSSKGIDIEGRSGQPVLAASDGKVVYSGSGLRGYGKLVIIKHNKTFLSAYANNNQLLVKEGQSVKKGQKIAEMGNTDATQVKLHFEIRRFGKPVNPMQYLDSKP